MMKLKKTIYVLLCLMTGVCALSGCIEEYEADIPSEDSDLLVVEGTICAGKLNKFYLSRTKPLQDDKGEWSDNLWSGQSVPMIKNAFVSVRGSDGSEYVAQPNDGYYTCSIDHLSPDVEYYLHLEADGEVYESEPQKPLPTEKIADIRGVQDTPESNIDVLITPAEPFESNQANYYTWTYDETWEVHPDYITFIYFDTKTMSPIKKLDQFPAWGWIDATGTTIIVGASTNYDGQHIQRLKMYDINRGDKRMYYRYSSLVHQRAISKAEYEYELARRQAGSEMGGLFTPLPSSLPTNVHCLTSDKRIIGYVGCSLNTSEYRFFLDAKDFSIYHPIQHDTRFWLEDPTDEDLLRMVYNGYFLCEWGGDGMETGSPDGIFRTAWARPSQLDVRLSGAYTEEPEFWSLTENVSY